MTEEFVKFCKYKNIDEKEIEARIKKLYDENETNNFKGSKIVTAIVNAISDNSAFISKILLENQNLNIKKFKYEILFLKIKELIEKKDYEKLEKFVKDVEIML